MAIGSDVVAKGCHLTPLIVSTRVIEGPFIGERRPERSTSRQDASHYVRAWALFHGEEQSDTTVRFQVVGTAVR